MLLAERAAVHEAEPVRVGGAELTHILWRVLLHRGTELLRAQHVRNLGDERPGYAGGVLDPGSALPPAFVWMSTTPLAALAP